MAEVRTFEIKSVLICINKYTAHTEPITQNKTTVQQGE